MFVGLGHPRCGTGFTASLLQAHGLDVRHERIGADGIVSWMQVARRPAVPWGNTLADYPPGTRKFLVARSPLAALNSVATENQMIRSVGFRSQVIWERRRIDLFVWSNQTVVGVHDFFGWAVMSLAHWFDICLEEQPEIIFRIEQPRDDALLSEFTGRGISREGKNLWENKFGSEKKTNKLDYPMDELRRVPKHHLSKLVEVTGRLGYPDDADILGRYL